MAKVYIVFWRAEDISHEEAVAAVSLQREVVDRMVGEMNAKFGPDRNGGERYQVFEVELDAFLSYHNPQECD